MKSNIFFLLFLIVSVQTTRAQLSYDTSITADRKNVIRINPTPSAIFGLETFVLGYERVIKEHQSISVNIGKLKFKQFVDLGLEQYNIISNRKSGGYSIAIDYRRYFKKRNRGFAPDGLYWGPFMTYYSYKHEIGLTYTDPSNAVKSDVKLEANLNMFHFGVEIGYQFVISRRLTVDLIFIGPSWGKYKADFSLDGSIDLNEESDLYEAVSTVIKNRMPGLSTILQDRKASVSGNFDTNTFGMRYLIQIGFLF